PSLRRNQKRPRPAINGFDRMNIRIAAPGPSQVKSDIAGKYSQPLCGSAAKGVPVISNGFQSGTCPAASDRPRKANRGNQKASMSGCWLVSSGSNANPRSANRTLATMSAGPAAAGAHFGGSRLGDNGSRAPAGASTSRVSMADKATRTSTFSQATLGTVVRPSAEGILQEEANR